ncbi:MAG: tRNA (5-methylaminomethyl-2-thiouridylate)-methyltransferase [Candidatus Cloacimonetes bacterium]|nr:tRNA (5-methylaminomethyl-2-thiouridylate)-methyltransferase [Candidatus Cloacimonadota bacterium]
MKKKYRCLALFSGGLDSMLSVVHMQRIGYEVIPVFFMTPFFGPEKAKKAAELINTELVIRDITDEHIKMLQNPRYGFGRNMNPCIDCHGLMFRLAAVMLTEFKADFLISGEVLGQRPMSQRHDALNSVGKLSKVKDLIVRPLSQKLLSDTLPVREGWVNKEDMLDIQGRGRHRQMQLAEEYGIKHFPNPGGGCLLTDIGYSRKLRDLISFDMLMIEFIKYLKIGRHFRISDRVKLIVGRDNQDNENLESISKSEIILQPVSLPGPMGVINSREEPEETEFRLAARVLLRYHNKLTGSGEVVFIKDELEILRIWEAGLDDSETKKLLI